MRSWRRALRRATVPGRLVLVAALLAGVLGMHGLADLLPATAGPVATEAAGPVATEGAAETHAHHAVTDVGTRRPRPRRHAPLAASPARTTCTTRSSAACSPWSAWPPSSSPRPSSGDEACPWPSSTGPGPGPPCPGAAARLLDPGPPLLLSLCVQRV